MSAENPPQYPDYEPDHPVPDDDRYREDEYAYTPQSRISTNGAPGTSEDFGAAADSAESSAGHGPDHTGEAPAAPAAPEEPPSVSRWKAGFAQLRERAGQGFRAGYDRARRVRSRAGDEDPETTHSRAERERAPGNGLSLVVAGLGENVVAHAKDVGYRQHDQFLARGNRGTRFAKAFAKGVFGSAMEAGAISRAERQILEDGDTGNLLAGKGGQHADYADAVVRRFQGAAEGFDRQDLIDENAGERLENLNDVIAAGGERGARAQRVMDTINDLIAQQINGAIPVGSSLAREARTRFNDLIRQHGAGEFLGKGGLFADNLEGFVERVEDRLSARLLTATDDAERAEQKEAIARLLSGADIMVGAARVGSRTEYDKTVAEYASFLTRKLHNIPVIGRRGQAVEYGKVAILAAATIGVGAYLGKRVISKVSGIHIPGTGIGVSLGSGVFAGLNERRTLRNEFVRHSREVDHSEVDQAALRGGGHANRRDRRANFEQRGATVERENGRQLAENIDVLYTAVAGGDVTQEQALVNAVADADARRRFSRGGRKGAVEFLRFENETDRADLAVAIARAKVLSPALRTRIDDRVTAINEGRVGDLADQSREARHNYGMYRNQRVAFAVAKGIAFGVGSSALADAIGFGVHAAESGLGHTSAESAVTVEDLGGKETPTKIDLGHDSLGRGHVIELPAGFHGSVDGHILTITGPKDFHTVTEHLNSNGSLSPAAAHDLQHAGFSIGSETFNHQSVPGTITVHSGHEFMSKHEAGTTGAHWETQMDNNTPSPDYDQNELGLDTAAGHSGSVAISTNMTESGSFHGGDHADFRELAKQGKMKITLTADRGDQSHVFTYDAVLGKDGQLHADIPKGDPGRDLFDNHGHLTHGIMTISRVNEVRADHSMGFSPLAAVVGDHDGDPITTTVPHDALVGTTVITYAPTGDGGEGWWGQVPDYPIPGIVPRGGMGDGPRPADDQPARRDPRPLQRPPARDENGITRQDGDRSGHSWPLWPHPVPASPVTGSRPPAADGRDLPPYPGAWSFGQPPSADTGITGLPPTWLPPARPAPPAPSAESPTDTGIAPIVPGSGAPDTPPPAGLPVLRTDDEITFAATDDESLERMLRGDLDVPRSGVNFQPEQGRTRPHPSGFDDPDSIIQAYREGRILGVRIEIDADGHMHPVVATQEQTLDDQNSGLPFQGLPDDYKDPEMQQRAVAYLRNQRGTADDEMSFELASGEARELNDFAAADLLLAASYVPGLFDRWTITGETAPAPTNNGPAPTVAGSDTTATASSLPVSTDGAGTTTVPTSSPIPRTPTHTGSATSSTAAMSTEPVSWKNPAERNISAAADEGHEEPPTLQGEIPQQYADRGNAFQLRAERYLNGGLEGFTPEIDPTTGRMTAESRDALYDRAVAAAREVREEPLMLEFVGEYLRNHPDVTQQFDPGQLTRRGTAEVQGVMDTEPVERFQPPSGDYDPNVTPDPAAPTPPRRTHTGSATPSTAATSTEPIDWKNPADYAPAPVEPVTLEGSDSQEPTSTAVNGDAEVRPDSAFPEGYGGEIFNGLPEGGRELVVQALRGDHDAEARAWLSSEERRDITQDTPGVTAAIEWLRGNEHDRNSDYNQRLANAAQELIDRYGPELLPYVITPDLPAPAEIAERIQAIQTGAQQEVDADGGDTSAAQGGGLRPPAFEDPNGLLDTPHGTGDIRLQVGADGTIRPVEATDNTVPAPAETGDRRGHAFAERVVAAEQSLQGIEAQLQGIAGAEYQLSGLGEELYRPLAQLSHAVSEGDLPADSPLSQRLRPPITDFMEQLRTVVTELEQRQQDINHLGEGQAEVADDLNSRNVARIVNQAEELLVPLRGTRDLQTLRGFINSAIDTVAAYDTTANEVVSALQQVQGQIREMAEDGRARRALVEQAQHDLVNLRTNLQGLVELPFPNMPELTGADRNDSQLQQNVASLIRDEFRTAAAGGTDLGVLGQRYVILEQLAEKDLDGDVRVVVEALRGHPEMTDGIVAELNAEANDPYEKISGAGYSEEAERHPGDNQDSYLSDDDQRVYFVADGLGGSVGGSASASSRLMVSTIQRSLQSGPAGTSLTVDQAVEGVRKAIMDAHEASKAPGVGESVLAGVRFFKTPEGQLKAAIFRVGDARVYRLRNGVLECLTVDNDLTPEKQRIFDNIRSQQDIDNIADLEIRRHAEVYFAQIDIRTGDDYIKGYSPRNFVDSAVGDHREDPKIAIDVEDAQEGDLYMDSGDGMHDNLTFDEIAAILNSHTDKSDREAIAHDLVTRSRERSHDGTLRSKDDDITVLVVTL